MPKNIIRRMTIHLYQNQIHQQTEVVSLHKHNLVTGDLVEDPFKFCKNLKDVKEVFLTKEKKTISKLFEEGFDFILAKIDKRGLSNFQQILPHELLNSVRFIKNDN